MSDDANDGGTDSWTSGGAVALAAYAPDVLESYETLVSVRPLGVHDEVLESPDVVEFARQFGADGAGIDGPARDRLTQVAGNNAAAVVNMVWISDVAPRIRGALDAIFGPSTEWPGRRRYPVSDTQIAIEGFTRSVALLDNVHLDESGGPSGAAQAALALTDAMARTPSAIPGSVIEAVHELLTPAQAVEVVLDAARGSVSKIGVSLEPVDPPVAPIL